MPETRRLTRPQVLDVREWRDWMQNVLNDLDVRIGEDFLVRAAPTADQRHRSRIVPETPSRSAGPGLHARAEPATSGLPSNRCVECGNPAGVGAWAEVTGYERPREGGGTNHVALRQRSGRVICETCMHERQRGALPGQGKIA